MAGKKKKRSWRPHFSRFRNRAHKSKKIPILPLAGFGAMLATPAWAGRSILDDITKGDWNSAIYDMREKFLMVDNQGKFHAEMIFPNYAPLIFGVVGHMVAQKFGLNRYFDRIPVVGKYLSL